MRQKRDTVICTGTSRILDAGMFNSYMWNTGSQTQTITVNIPGIYTLQVTDSNQCSGSGSLDIRRMAQPPANFLPGDTSICNYGTITLTPLNTFAGYLWSTGESSKNIIIAQAGQYWLQATDNHHCTGTDTMQVQLKECLKGLYIPNAFTPGNGGPNNNFKPLLYGTILRYEFIIYNRYGQVLFNSQTPGESWDGTYKGQPQNAGGYVWLCHYHLSGGMEKIEKGSFMLLR